jgi:hypothetical protein
MPACFAMSRMLTLVKGFSAKISSAASMMAFLRARR